ncbi:hypothetical protein BHE74_00004401 [Ensete ventricosum]|nr:hypothetical protein GW17_00057799 [Ensete ventricosum]RWW86805.1 hypothetical protein BHE74_00004401 [Ensete ventricosum]RZR80460.1 hypothetical protein BHM03_00006508 [Ensete ventricosum]
MVTRDAIKCCVSCILPCGALDVIRIVHVSGRVEEISFANTAGDIMQAHPKYVLRKPPPSALSGGVEAPKVMTLPPNAELQRGKKYFLMPVAVPAPEKARFDAKETRRRKKKGGDSKIVMRLQPIRLCFLTRGICMRSFRRRCRAIGTCGEEELGCSDCIWTACRSLAYCLLSLFMKRFLDFFMS